jgi:hypothetical protein
MSQPNLPVAMGQAGSAWCQEDVVMAHGAFLSGLVARVLVATCCRCSHHRGLVRSRSGLLGLTFGWSKLTGPGRVVKLVWTTS